MIIRILKLFLLGLLAILSLFILWMIFPRIWSSLNPDKPPVGYYFTPPLYAAIWLGIEKLADLEPEIPEDIEEIKDIEYKNINGKSLQLDIYHPKNLDKPAPLLVFIHGGSAGAHLATLAAYGWKNPKQKNDTSGLNPPDLKVKAVVDIYGPVDLTTEYARNHPLIAAFLDNKWDEAPEIFREASPINYLDKSDPPTLILHGTSDRLVPFSQSDMLKNKLDSLGVPCVLHRFPGWPHTMDIVLRVNKYCQIKMDEFFSQYLN